MKIRFTKNPDNDFDASTYILVACILLTILVGAVKIIFF